MLCGEFDARASGFASRSAGNDFEQSAETHAIADKKHRGEKPKLDPGIIADVVLTFFDGFCIIQNLKSGKASSERKIRNLMQVVRNL